MARLRSLSLALGFLVIVPLAGHGQAWLGYGGDAQHSAVSAVPTLSLDAIRWSTPVDTTSPSQPILIHYGSPVITAQNTVIVPVRNGSNIFSIEGLSGLTGQTLWSSPTDYRTAPSSGGWVPSFAPTLTPAGTLYYEGAGGTVYKVANPNSASPTTTAINFLPDYAANKSLYDGTVFISTPITSDAAGNIYFGYETNSQAPGGLQSGIARITPAGVATYVSANTAIGINQATGYRVGTNAAPALSSDGSTVYLALNGANSDYLVALDAATLSLKSPTSRVVLNGNIVDQSSASPTVGPNGDVFFGVRTSADQYHARGVMFHFSGDLSQTYTEGSFGWDITPSIVNSSLVPSYHGSSSYLILVKFNDYQSAGGTGVNKMALLDPTVSELDPVANAQRMKVVLSVAGVTPDGTPPGVDEWCVNTAAVDPFTKSALVNSEDGYLYRWDFSTNTLSQNIALQTDGGAFEAYTPTAIGPDGAVYAINEAVLFSVVPEPSPALLCGAGALLLSCRPRRAARSSKNLRVC